MEYTEHEGIRENRMYPEPIEAFAVTDKTTRETRKFLADDPDFDKFLNQIKRKKHGYHIAAIYAAAV